MEEYNLTEPMQKIKRFAREFIILKAVFRIYY